MDLPEIESVERLTLGPDDTLVVRLDRSPTSAYEADQLRQQVRAITAHERVLIVDRSVDLIVVAPEPDG